MVIVLFILRLKDENFGKFIFVIFYKKDKE